MGKVPKAHFTLGTGYVVMGALSHPPRTRTSTGMAESAGTAATSNGRTADEVDADNLPVTL